MPGLLSWISELFGSKQGAPPPTGSRLLNPAASSTINPVTGTATLHKLEQHLFCWLLDSPPSALTPNNGDAHAVLTKLANRVQQGTLDELPQQPETLPMLLRALADPNVSRQEISDILLQDSELSDQLLIMANSPFFRPGEDAIDSVDKAVFMLGINGIRNIISATLLRRMMAARNSGEALFAQRAWHWGLCCGRAAELIAQIQNKDGSAYFLVGLLPALSYLTLHRETLRIYRSAQASPDIRPSVIQQALQLHAWDISQHIANHWNLPPRYSAYLLEAERPVPRKPDAPLNDGIILGTREILRHSHQRNMGETELLGLLALTEAQFQSVHQTLLKSLREGN
ncbi:HDOD domain-containing protein [Marinobacter sp. SS21]|uniref:HDOD domain-containing protein n=1 Tax=Marinobacter sp. SS21 TaxID=2979460 RepID=UPI00232F8DA4|nr:HDOD domain-containing protein [Marinobacter sp. SS21]MDC0663622.1 HDOD domain-containing protein [Marinobacter sp. SS21]